MARKKNVVAETEDVAGINMDNDEIVSDICSQIEGAEILSNDDISGDFSLIDTGNLALNYICSGKFYGGGIASGRITEIFGGSSSGKTLISSQLLRGVQKQNGIGVLLDTESAYSSSFGEVLGIDPKKLIVMHPETLEDCFKKIAEIIGIVRKKSNDMRPVLIVYDSIAASASKREKERIDNKEDIGSLMGLRASICSDYLRSINQILAKQRAAVVIINQTREKIGVMFGCFNYSTRITLEDGTQMKIGKIVNQKIPARVKCYNNETHEVEYRPIVNWYNNGKADNFLQFKIEKIGGNGVSQFAATHNHCIFTPSGSSKAEDLKVGDYVLGYGESVVSKLQESIVIGSMLGDGNLKDHGPRTCSLRIGHGKTQIEYCKWKQSFFSNIIGYSGANKFGGWGFDTSPNIDFYEMKKLGYDGKKRFVSQELADKLDLLALAIWYMDDGTYRRTKEKWGWGKAHLCETKMSLRDLEIISDAIVKLGVPKPSIKEGKGLLWYGDDCGKFQEKISKYIHPSMRYKIHSKFFNDYQELDPEFISPVPKLVPLKILDIYIKPKTQSMSKFDIEVEKNHNYFVDGILVHNSNETTSGGGNSLQFYCSTRLRCGSSSKKIIDSKKRIIGINMNVKNVKNKIYKPFREAQDLELIFDKGINPLSGLLALLVEEDRIVQSGAWYQVVGQDKKFQAKNLYDVLLEFPSLVDAESREQIEEYVNIGKPSFEVAMSDQVERVEGSAEEMD